MISSRSAAWARSLTLCAVVACGGENEWSGEHLDYDWEPPRHPCKGTLEAVDAFIPFLAEQLNLDLRSFKRLAYTWESYESLSRRGFEGPSLAGLARKSHAYAIDPALLHELVHIVVHQRHPRRGLSFLDEGLATAFDPPDSLDIRFTESKGPSPRFERVDPRPYFDATPSDSRNYYRPAGAFVAYLLSKYGPDLLFELHDRLSCSSSSEDIAGTFSRVYGIDLNAEIDAFLEDDTCPAGATSTPQPYQCSAATIPWASPSRWEDVRAVSCLDGSEGTLELPHPSVTLDVPDDGQYRIEFFGDEEARAKLLPCGPCPWLAEDTYLVSGSRLVTLRKGRYALTYRGDPLFETSYVGATLTRVEYGSP